MSRPPPGPKWFRPINFLQAGLVPPVPVLKRLAAQYGDPFRVSYLTGPVTFVGNPEALRALYTADPACFDVWGVDVVEPVFGRTSVVVSAGEHHSRDRKLLTPAFTGTAMRAYGAAIASITTATTDEWVSGQSFVMLDATQSITLDIMIRVVFGVQQEALVAKARRAVLELIDALSVSIFLFPSLRREFGGRGPWARYSRAVEALNALLRGEIRARRHETAPTDDVLSVMMRARYDDGTAMGEVELLDQLRALLFAGHEATATVLAWACYWLHRHPAMLARVTDEIDALGPAPTPEAFAALPYLEAVLRETLRLNPPVVDSARKTLVPFEMAGYTVPANEAIRASASLLHARADLFPEPETFRPERFLERKFSSYEYIPFGGGPRRCLGAAFAMFEMKVVLGTMLRTQRLSLASQAPVAHVRRRLTLGPKGGIPMVVEGRRATPKVPAVPATRRAGDLPGQSAFGGLAAAPPV